MECVLSGNQIKLLSRAVNCLARVGNELLIEALPDKLSLRTLNSSWSAFLGVTFKRFLFDTFQVTPPTARCIVLLKAVCTVFQTAPGNMERLTISLADNDATKLQWTVDCMSGMKKSYWITCNNDMEMQNVLVDRRTLPSHLVVKPKDLSRLLTHFQSSLHEITLIATEPVTTPIDDETEAKAIELKSYIDPARDTSDGALHTKLWIDPAEELVEYSHTGAAVDVTFSVKELKAFIAFCEGAEADMLMYFDKAGVPLLVAPRFGLDDAAHSDFDATLILATLMDSQLHSDESAGATHHAAISAGEPAISNQSGSRGHAHTNASTRRVNGSSASTPRSDQTAIWSELSGRDASIAAHQMQESGDASEEIPLQRHQPSRERGESQHRSSSHGSPSGHQEGLVAAQHHCHSTDLRHLQGQTFLQPLPGESPPVKQNNGDMQPTHHRSMQYSGFSDDDDDDTEADEVYVPTTPPERSDAY
ncbi:hypothetical protein CY35_02G164900 [Sphagnum magellanicum]|nr:hypothetical protein CY35_02G164900 [Sphagnum magellanicum]